MPLKPKQRIQLEKLRDEISSHKRGAIARYVEWINNETWAKNLGKIVDRLNKIEKKLKEQNEK